MYLQYRKLLMIKKLMFYEDLMKCDVFNEYCRYLMGKSKKNKKKPGNDLLSHPPKETVPLALGGLTSVFEMGTGGSPPLLLPGNILTIFFTKLKQERKTKDTIINYKYNCIT